MIGVVLAVLKFFGGANVKAAIDGFRDVMVNKTNVAGQTHVSDNEAGRAIAGQYMDSTNRLNDVKLEARKIEGKWGPTLVASLILFVLPFGLHTWLVVLDSMPLFGHVVGSWGIEKLPGKFEDTEHQVILSLFFAAPAVGAVTILARALRK